MAVFFSAKSSNGEKLIGIGLTEENIKRLKEEMPFNIEPEIKKRLGIDFELVIFYGKTEETIQEELRDFIDKY